MGSEDIVREFTVCGNHVTVHVPAHCAGEARPDAAEGRSGETSPALPDSLPAVYLHVHDGDGSEVLQLCHELGYREFVLAAIRPRCWNDDLTPWGCPGLFADDAPFAGKAAEQLRLLESQIIPRVEGGAHAQPAFAQRGARHARCRRAVRSQRRAHPLRAKPRQPLQGTRPTYGEGHRLGASSITLLNHRQNNAMTHLLS